MSKNEIDRLDLENIGGSKEGTSPVARAHENSGARRNALDRYINWISVVSFGFILLASWETFAASFQIALLNGGPASMFYGGLLACIGECAVGFSLAELASIDPTVGAQYRWSANLAPIYPRFWGLIQGWLTVSAWCFACGGPPLFLSNMITALAIFNNAHYEPERWHTSLIMIATLIVPFAFNLWFRKSLNTVEAIGAVLHICLFIVFVTLLVIFGTRQRDGSVFEELIWESSGWDSKGVSFGLGLLPATFSLTGLDSVLHLSDEVKEVQTRVPQSIAFACVINSIFLMAFIVILLLFMGPLDTIPQDAPLPLLNVMYNVTGSKTAATLLITAIVVLFFLALFNILASVSRLIWAFARDNGLPFSSSLAYVHPTLKLPVNALILVGFIVVCLSLIYLASATAFNALLSLQALALHASYFLPILFMLLRRLRGPQPSYGPFKLGALGVPLNLFSLCFLTYAMLWMPFPVTLPVNKDNMNYAGPVLGAVLLGALLDWFLTGRKRFQMPVVRYQ